MLKIVFVYTHMQCRQAYRHLFDIKLKTETNQNRKIINPPSCKTLINSCS